MFIDLRERGREERGRDRNMDVREKHNWFPPLRVQPGIKPIAWVCALSGNWTCNHLLYGTMLQSTEPPGKGSISFFMLAIYLLKLLQNFLSILITIFWTLYLINCLPPFHLALFLEICPTLSYRTCFSVSPFWLLLCVYLWVAGISAIPCSLAKVALHSKHSIRPCGTIS